jgi:shikimate kinase
MNNIFLTGFMGSGKTTIGKKLAAKLEITHIDSDDYVEKKAGKTINQIFENSGELVFRKLEKAAISEISNTDSCVVSLGGGALVNPKNIRRVKKHGVLFYLKTSREEILRRVKSTNTRPLLQNPDGSPAPEEETIKYIETLLKVRQPGYNKSDYIIITDNKKEDEVVNSILEIISSLDIKFLFRPNK